MLLRYKKSKKFQQKGDCKMIAHRGLSGIKRENTVAAFDLAGEHSYFGIETDVHVTSDNKYVIIHDSFTSRVSATSYLVEKTPLDTLRKVKLYAKSKEGGEKETRIPTLEEYVLSLKEHGKVGVLEMKNHFEEQEVWDMCAEIESLGYMDHIIFISFYLENLVALRKKYPLQPAQYLTLHYNKNVLKTLIEHKLDIDINFRALRPKAVREMHENGIKVNCWTVDRRPVARWLVKMGVDYITTNILE